MCMNTIKERSQTTDLCILLTFFPSHLRCAPEKGPGRHRPSTQNGFMVSREKQNRKAFTTPQKKKKNNLISLLLFLLSCFSSFLKHLFYRSKAFFLDDFSSLREWEGGRGEEWVRKAAVAGFRGQT